MITSHNRFQYTKEEVIIALHRRLYNKLKKITYTKSNFICAHSKQNMTNK